MGILYKLAVHCLGHSIIQVIAFHGPRVQLSKPDIKEAYSMLPVHLQNWYLMAMRWNGQCYTLYTEGFDSSCRCSPIDSPTVTAATPCPLLRQISICGSSGAVWPGIGKGPHHLCTVRGSSSGENERPSTSPCFGTLSSTTYN